MKPPSDSQERDLYKCLLTELAEEFLPCGRAECLALEEIVVLELRRIKIQEAQMGDLELDEASLKRILLLSRYETDTLNKLDKKRKLLNELQSTRAQRRGLALESALVQHQVAAMKQQTGQEAGLIARRALGREMHDLMGLAPEVADEAAARLLALPSASGSSGPRRGAGAAFQPFAVPGTASVSPAPWADGQAAPAADSDARPAARTRLIPGSPWDPWRDAQPEQLEAWNDELIERKKAALREELAELEQAGDPPAELAGLFPGHYDPQDEAMGAETAEG